MSKIYEVRSTLRDATSPHSWGARRTREEAEALLASMTTGERSDWAKNTHKDWRIEEIDTTGLFQIPSTPRPRERYSTKLTESPTSPGTWNTLHVDVLDDTGSIVCSYRRNYSNMYRTFEPFRQGDRMMALISSNYTTTSVIDLATGEVLASEEPQSMGFCPVGFYVPDWWDIYSDSILPGSMQWNEDHELPKGDFGFVWGCIWGDDSSWKVQYLDLAHVQVGKIVREEKFGYLELETHSKLEAREFIRCSPSGGKWSVTFSTPATFDLSSGIQAPPASLD
jgi:hypothetical protein